MALAISRYLALPFAIGLGIGETIINWGHWQFAPLWIIDYVIVAWLLYAFLKTRHGEHVHILLAAWALTSGIFYMALFLSLDPELASDVRPGAILLTLMGVMFVSSLIGFFSALWAIQQLGAEAGAGHASPRRSA